MIPIQDEIVSELEIVQSQLKSYEGFIRDEEFYERLVLNADWLKAKEDLTKEEKGIRTNIEHSLDLLVETRGSRKTDVQDAVLEYAIRLDQMKRLMNWFDAKVAMVKQAREAIIRLKEQISRLRENVNA